MIIIGSNIWFYRMILKMSCIERAIIQKLPRKMAENRIHAIRSKKRQFKLLGNSRLKGDLVKLTLTAHIDDK